MKRNFLFQKAVTFLVLGCVFIFTTSGTKKINAVALEDETLTVRGTLPLSSLQTIFDDFSTQTSTTIDYTEDPNISDYLLNCLSLSNCPDVAFIPNSGIIQDLIKQGSVEPLDSILPDFNTYYGAAWRDIGSVNQTLYGLPFNANSKSMVYFSPSSFSSISATKPNNWSELLATANSFVSNSQIPFSIGAESGPASGWPLTDIFENILVRTAGPEAHRDLVNHTLSWTDPSVVLAMERFTDIIGEEAYIYEGIDSIITTSFIDAFTNVFPGSYANIYFGATFHINFLWSGAVPLVDYDYFLFPIINPDYGKPMIGGVDLVILLSNTVSAQSFIQFLAEPETGELWITSSASNISPNNAVDLNLYSNPIIKNLAEEIVNTEVFLYDLDDQLPSELQTYFWGALLDFVENQDEIPRILEGIETKATELQGLPYSVFLPQVIR